MLLVGWQERHLACKKLVWWVWYHAPRLKFFTGQMPFLPPNQQHQSTEGTTSLLQYFSRLSFFNQYDWKNLLRYGNNYYTRLTAWVSRHQKGKTSLDLNEAKNDGVLGYSGIS